MTVSAILSIILKIVLVIVIFFVWVMTLGLIYAKIDEAKKEILEKIDSININVEDKILKDKIDDLDNKFYGYYLDILDKLKKKKKKKDNINEENL